MTRYAAPQDGLPPQTQVYCAHEYTESNAKFALAIDPDNAALKAMVAEIGKLRSAGKPSVPSLMSDEMVANPFLTAPDEASFADARAKKDKF